MVQMMYGKKDLRKIIEIILKHVDDVEKIILFGSYARKEERKDSDIDILILVRSPLNRTAKLEWLTKTRWDVAKLGYKADFIIKSVKDYKRDVEHPTFSKTISLEGKMLWEAS
jgi:predicted nucleotidyltransferase